MLLSTPLPFVEGFISELDNGLREDNPDMGLSRKQRYWLVFCLMGILLTNSLCWARFERISLGQYKVGALSWMFRQAKIPWEMLLQMGVAHVLKQHGITEGVLATDDSDHGRSKTTKRIFKAHKLKDKKSGGYINGQTIVLLVLVTPRVTLPVGFEFYQADPAQRSWEKEDKRLQKQGVAKKKRPPAPAPESSISQKTPIGSEINGAVSSPPRSH